MVTVREGHSGNPSPITRPAPSRSLVLSKCQVECLAEAEGRDEQALLERIKGICLEYGQRYARQVTIRSYQTLPCEAVSILDPPECVLLARLHLGEQQRDQTTGDVEVIAVLRGGEVSILLR